MPGTYQIPSADDDGTTSSAVLKTNVSIEGMYPTAKPVIQGRFEINGAKSVEITNVILDGSQNNSADQTFNFKEAASDLQKLVVKDSEIKNYAKGLYYINVAAQIKEITFNGCDIHDITCDGGDFLDCRKGYIEALNLKNCTFYNSCTNREFIRYDKGELNDQTVITVDHCTLMVYLMHQASACSMFAMVVAILVGLTILLPTQLLYGVTKLQQQSLI